MHRALALGALLLVTACGSVDEIDLTRSGEATIPGVPGGPPVPGTVAVPIDLAIGRDALQQEGIDPNDVDSARLVALRLEVLSGASLETWLDSVAFRVDAPGLPGAVIAQRSGIRGLPAGTRAVDLEMSGADLKPYMLAPTAAVTAEATGNAPAEDTEVRATATIRVDVSVSGLLD